MYKLSNLLARNSTKKITQDYFYQDFKYANLFNFVNFWIMHKVDCWKY